MNAFHSHLLATICGAAIGAGVVGASRDQRMPETTVNPGIERSDIAATRPVESSLGAMQERGTDTRRHSQKTTDAGDLTFLSNGNVVVPADLAERIRIRAMDTEGNVNAEELALIGLAAEKSRKLQDVLDGLKKWELERESRLAKIIRKNEKEVVIGIPGEGVDQRQKQEFDDSINEIFGPTRPFVEGALSHVAALTGDWGTAEMVVTARPISDGYTEYKLFVYESSRPPSLNEGADLSVGALSIHSFRTKEIPERLRHLFD
jgi:hypothetical protein